MSECFLRRTVQLKLCFLPTESSGDSQKSCTQQTKRSRFRRIQVGVAQLNMTDALSELAFCRVDILCRRSSHHLAVVKLAGDGAAECVKQPILYVAYQRPSDRTNECAGKNHALWLAVVTLTDYYERR